MVIWDYVLQCEAEVTRLARVTAAREEAHAAVCATRRHVSHDLMQCQSQYVIESIYICSQ